MNPLAPPLWRQLAAAASVLTAVSNGRGSAPALEAIEPALRPGAQAIALDTLRQLGRARALRQRLASRAPPPAVDSLLCCALALLWREDDQRYEAFTLVDQTVEAAKRQRTTRPQAAFINGCLRRFLRDRAALVAATDDEPEARWNHPRWWIEQVRADHPDHWQRILEADNARPPLTLRVNTRKSSVHGYLSRLADLGIEARCVGPFAVVIDRPLPVDRIPGFAEGIVSVQDAAAQLAAPLLLARSPSRASHPAHGQDERGETAPRPLRVLDESGDPAPRRLRVLDACAAPGGKTAHLLELADCEVVAIEIDRERCERIEQTLARLSLSATMLVADAGRPDQWWHTECESRLFDAILLDAPCTASGIARRHPDVRWLRRPGDIAQLAAVQSALLEALWPLLAVGGRLLYATCSVFRAEGSAQIETFLARNNDAMLCASPGHLLPGNAALGPSVRDNAGGGPDGFFYALLQKKRPT
ncbi:MAG: 16S rRNA (cytosine(967)-C(5))-methyltransferase RsmB [Burkholderiales bacterium]